METVFKTLFTIDILHNYYSSGYSEDFLITPTPACADMMRKYRMLFFNNSRGCRVLYEADSNGDAICGVEDDIKLYFMLLSKNSLLVSLSDLPISETRNKIYFISNRDSSGQSITELHSSPDYLSGNDLFPLKPQRFTYSFETQNRSDKITLTDYSDNIVLNKTVEAVEGNFIYDVDLTPFDPGLFDLKINDTERMKFYASNYLCTKIPFGVIEITCESNEEKEYTINITTRKTFWRYNVVIQKDTGINSDDLLVESAVYNFNSGGTKLLSNGTTASLFTSAELIPFSQCPVKGIQLKKKNNHGSGHGTSILIDNLESPAPLNLNRSLVAGKPTGNVFFSDVFIYV